MRNVLPPLSRPPPEPQKSRHICHLGRLTGEPISLETHRQLGAQRETAPHSGSWQPHEHQNLEVQALPPR